MAGETTTASLNDLIHTEQIDAIILSPNRPAYVYQLISWIRDASKGGSEVYQFPRWDPIDMTAGTKTEGTGTFTVTEQTTNSATATAGVVGIGIELTDEAAQDAMQSLSTFMILNEDRGAKRVNEDILSLFTSCTNTHTVGNAAFTLVQWGIAKAKYKALNPRGSRHAYVGSNASIKNLEADLRTAGSAILSNPLYMNGDIIKNPGQGYIGQYEGFEIYESSSCPDNDADTISTAFLVAGDQGALGLALWWPWRHQIHANPAAAGNELFTSARYGVCITNQSNILEVISED